MVQHRSHAESHHALRRQTGAQELHEVGLVPATGAQRIRRQRWGVRSFDGVAFQIARLVHGEGELGARAVAFRTVAQRIDQILAARHFVDGVIKLLGCRAIDHVPQGNGGAHIERKAHLVGAVGHFNGALLHQPDPQRIDITACDLVIAGIGHGGVQHLATGGDARRNGAVQIVCRPIANTVLFGGRDIAAVQRAHGGHHGHAARQLGASLRRAMAGRAITCTKDLLATFVEGFRLRSVELGEVDGGRRHVSAGATVKIQTASYQHAHGSRNCQTFEPCAFSHCSPPPWCACLWSGPAFSAPHHARRGSNAHSRYSGRHGAPAAFRSRLPLRLRARGSFAAFPSARWLS